MFYRVFVTRHFIDVCYFDIEADTKRKARNKARKAANKLRDGTKSRANATDNSWIPDDGIEIDFVGYPDPETYKAIELMPGVWKETVSELL